MPVKDRITDLIVVLDSVISSVNDIMDPEFKKISIALFLTSAIL